jgi:hypothetical protein
MDNVQEVYCCTNEPSSQTFRSYRKPILTTGGIRCADHATLSIRKSLHYFANKRRPLGRHSSLADQSHGGFFFYYLHSVLCRDNPYLSQTDHRGAYSTETPHCGPSASVARIISRKIHTQMIVHLADKIKFLLTLLAA